MKTNPVIITNDLTRRFGDTVAVDYLTLEVYAGEVFGFVGHNGAGRDTMLLKTLATANLLLALVTTGCGLAIHYKWVGEMEPTPQIVLGALAVLLALATTVVALA